MYLNSHCDKIKYAFTPIFKELIMHISIRGFPPGTSEAEIREPLEEFGVNVFGISIQTSDSDDRYLAIIDVDTDEAGCKFLTDRLNGKIWKGKKLHAASYLFLK